MREMSGRFKTVEEALDAYHHELEKDYPVHYQLQSPGVWEDQFILHAYLKVNDSVAIHVSVKRGECENEKEMKIKALELMLRKIASNLDEIFYERFKEKEE